jgi:hypothetical protein
MGEHGPIPKRSEERRRRNKPESPAETVEVAGTVEMPPAPRGWHAIARGLYESLQDSGQSKFFEPSDWQAAYLLCESLSRDLKPQAVGVSLVTGKILKARQPLKGASLAAYLKAFSALGVAEGDRRRMGIEISRRTDKPSLAPVTVMDEYRDAFGD